MDKIVIRGKRPLSGEVQASGAKNSALPLMVASLLTPEPVRLDGVPAVRDIRTMARLLARLGVSIQEGERSLALDAGSLSSWEAPYDLVKTMRASVLVLGPLLGRLGKAAVSLPGGCAIGSRPIDLHIEGLKKLGAAISIEHGDVVARADRLRGGRVAFDIPTVTGTENIMMAACLGRGETVIENAACEPEIDDLAGLLRGMGARIEGAGTPRIVIEGQDALHGTAHRIIPDRIEGATYLVAGALCGGEVTLSGCVPGHMSAVLEKLKAAGVEVTVGADRVTVQRSGPLSAIDVRTAGYPGFPTDMQAQFMLLCTQATGISTITETVFENRFMHAWELRRMGAAIRIEEHTALVQGPTTLEGARVMATDLRASASLILAGLVAEGETVVDRVYHIDRGYEKIEEKLGSLGAHIKRVS